MGYEGVRVKLGYKAIGVWGYGCDEVIRLLKYFGIMYTCMM